MSYRENKQILLALFITMILMAVTLFTQAQILYEVDKKYQADKVIYLTDHKWQADWIVYYTKEKWEANTYGIFYWSSNKWEADTKIYFTSISFWILF